MAITVNPTLAEVLGEQCYASIRDVPEPIDTVAIYLGAERSSPLIDEIIRAKPRRIIFNPAAENDELAEAAEDAGIAVIIGLHTRHASDWGVLIPQRPPYFARLISLDAFA